MLSKRGYNHTTIIIGVILLAIVIFLIIISGIEVQLSAIFTGGGMLS